MDSGNKNNKNRFTDIEMDFDKYFDDLWKDINLKMDIDVNIDISPENVEKAKAYIGETGKPEETAAPETVEPKQEQPAPEQSAAPPVTETPAPPVTEAPVEEPTEPVAEEPEITEASVTETTVEEPTVQEETFVQEQPPIDVRAEMDAVADEPEEEHITDLEDLLAFTGFDEPEETAEEPAAEEVEDVDVTKLFDKYSLQKAETAQETEGPDAAADAEATDAAADTDAAAEGGQSVASTKEKAEDPEEVDYLQQIYDEWPDIDEGCAVALAALRKKEAKKAAKRAERENHKSDRRLKISFAVVLAAVLIIGAVIVGGISIVHTQVDKVTKVQVNREALEIDPRVAKELKGYRNIVLLGIDARDMDDDANTRSDAMIVVSIEKKTGTVNLISLYRDTYVSLGADYGLDKLTHAYFYGGATQTMRAINRNLDLNCEEVVVVNWKSVADTVDALGGVDINIKKSEIKEMNKYIIDTANHIGGSRELIQHAGTQTLNGNQAVTYARIRKDASSGDHRRNERMKILISACFEKAQTLSVSELNEICDIVLPQIKTNMSNSQMMELILDLNAYNIQGSESFPYKTMSWTHNGVWYGPPVTLESNVIQLHEQFFNQPDYQPTDTVLKISGQISRLTGAY